MSTSKKRKMKVVEKKQPEFHSGTKTYEEIVKAIKVIREELEKIDRSVNINENIRVL